MKKKIPLSKIQTPDELQDRAEINEDAVEEYAERMKAGDKFPEVVVFTEDDKQFFCASGRHRIFAHLRNKKESESIECDVRKGSIKDALKFALGANSEHGIRRSHADKRKAVEMALKTFPNLSDRGIADMCKLSHTFVASMRPEPVQQKRSTPPPKRTGMDGKQRSTPPPKPMKPADSAPVPMEKVEKKKQPSKPADATGLEIPQESIELWNMAQERAQELMAHVSIVRVALKKAQDAKDILFKEVDLTDCIAKLNQVYVDVERAKPYAVCYSCNGKTPHDCNVCKGRGFLSEFYWKHNVDEQTKNLRLTNKKK